MLKARVSSSIKSVDLKQEVGPLIIDERLNTQGSKKAKELVLNDDFDGGHTQFRVGGHNNDILNVAPKTGKLICFPASWYFYHRGETVTKGSKYVCTGWLSDHVTTFSNDTTGISPNFRETARKAGRKMLLLRKTQ